MSQWTWISKSTILAVHLEQVTEHGGLPGIRDEASLDSAQHRPLNKAQYGSPSVTALAAAYGFGLARNHPFVDGNKRVAFVATELFLNLNSYQLAASDQACLETFLGLAAGTVSENQLATWLETNTTKI